MDFNLKNYQIVKLKKYFKNNNFFLVFQSARLSLTKWTHTEQNLKKLKLNYYKPLNKTTVKVLQNSVHKNFSSVINGFILLITTDSKASKLNLESIVKNLRPSFSLVSVKLNNKMYSLSQLKGMKDLSYKKNVFNLHKTLDKQLKTTYLLTSKKKVSK